jgi:hypothetical protein
LKNALHVLDPTNDSEASIALGLETCRALLANSA